jgi:hypothetical protein
MSVPDLSVVVCTHNPRPELLAETLAALRAQTLSQTRWELVVIDNASRSGAVPADCVAWHAAGRVVLEPRLGLTQARLRGLAETRAALVVFVDDDNVLAPDYLAQACAIAEAHPFVGAFGGQIDGRFETPPPRWAVNYLGYLAVVEVRAAMWSNLSWANPTSPCGAGLCVRRVVAQRHVEKVAADPVRLALGRIGQSLTSCEDSDLVLTACDLGLAAGVFPQLRLEHIIPARRLQLDYLCDLVRSTHASRVLLAHVRGIGGPGSRDRGRVDRLFQAYRRWRLPPEIRHLEAAAEEGDRLGVAQVNALRATSRP